MKQPINLDLIHELKKNEGQIVEYFYRGKYRKMRLFYVQNETSLMGNGCPTTIGNIRLVYVDDKYREWAGFWTNKIERVRFLTEAQQQDFIKSDILVSEKRLTAYQIQIRTQLQELFPNLKIEIGRGYNWWDVGDFLKGILATKYIISEYEPSVEYFAEEIKRQLDNQ